MCSFWDVIVLGISVVNGVKKRSGVEDHVAHGIHELPVGPNAF